MSEKMTCCPYCGSKEYYIQQHASGEMSWRMRFDGEEADNGGYYESLKIKTTSQYAWCTNCGKDCLSWNWRDGK